MLTIQSRQTEKIDLYNSLSKNVEEASGPQIVAQVDGTFRTLQQFREELTRIPEVRNDTVALEKLSISAKLYISMWSTVSQSFTFGKEKVCSLSSHAYIREA